MKPDFFFRGRGDGGGGAEMDCTGNGGFNSTYMLLRRFAGEIDLIWEKPVASVNQANTGSG